jgi:hypothetical protein
MAPLPKHPDLDLGAPSAAFKAVWASPTNYAFTILLLLGGDVVARALAQLAGGRLTPVAFSFGKPNLLLLLIHGAQVCLYLRSWRVHRTAHTHCALFYSLTSLLGWVSYATSAINSAVGENKLMPGSDTACTVINVDNNQSRSNGSWVLGRTMRDFEVWMGDPVKAKVQELKNSKFQYDKDQAKKQGKDSDSVKFPVHAGLVVSFWKFDPEKKHQLQKPGRDILFWSGIVVAVFQLMISAIPFGIYGNWGVFLVTASAICLCFTTGFWKQWGREKWACRQVEPGKRRTYILVSFRNLL